jgi:rubrerythrin
MIGTTAENLQAAAAGEHEEHTLLYPAFAETAELEGFKEIAIAWRRIGDVEKHHEARYLELFKNVQEGTVFKKKEKTRWKCRNCGYVHEGDTAPEACPACQHVKSFFEVLVEKF